ncbi:MAG: EF-P lysine aminoacylase EpmA [Pseudomonadales bacterium]|nr:EF-P lysine aminoacylase EpmA [Pseudomonadales bacterium]
MGKQTWQATASMEMLQARALLYSRIRHFFACRGVLEVETPLLSHASGSDPNINPIVSHCGNSGMSDIRPMFLQTSPEFAMKRLLAAGSGPVFQICKAFRDGEAGSRHNPEFTLLEWYRPGYDHVQLMDEVEALVTGILDMGSIERLAYRDLFVRYLGIDPHTAPTAELKALADRHINSVLTTEDRDVWLDLLFSHLVEPQLSTACFIYDYPVSQAALARVETDASGTPVARRFELVVEGMELANGYFELTDPAEQQARFADDQLVRQQRGLPQYPLDQHFLAALASGLPSCAGVALGLDRLLMLAEGCKSIQEVLAFPMDRA